MAGRPINYEARNETKQVVYLHIQKMQRDGIPLTKSNLARETGMSRQTFNKGYLAEYVDSLEIIDKYTSSAYKEPDSMGSLKREIEAFKNENKQLKKRNAANNKKHEEELRQKNEIIDKLTEEVETLRGEKYVRSLRDRVS